MTKEEMDDLLDSSFEKWNNRIIHETITLDILDSIPDSELEQAIFDNICLAFNEDFANEFEVIQNMNIGKQAFYSTWILEGEVNNGGFNQFYFNSSGEFAEMAEIGFSVIGAHKYAQLAKEANKTLRDNFEWLSKFDDGTLDSFQESYKDNPLNEIDDRFYELEEKERISDLRIKYIRNNRKQFIN